MNPKLTRSLSFRSTLPMNRPMQYVFVWKIVSPSRFLIWKPTCGSSYASRKRTVTAISISSSLTIVSSR